MRIPYPLSKHCNILKTDIILLKEELEKFINEKKGFSLFKKIYIFLFNFSNDFFIFDKTKLYVFRLEIDKKLLLEFNILKRKYDFIPKRLFFILFQHRFEVIRTKLKSDIVKASDIILMRPAFEDGGSQIKFVYGKENIILSFIYRHKHSWLIYNEINAMKNYQYDFVPKLLKIFTDICYTREFIPGITITYQMKSWLNAAMVSLKNLSLIYNQNQIHEKQTSIYITELKNSLYILLKNVKMLNTKIIKNLFEYCLSNLPVRIPLTKVHGDFALKNILYSYEKNNYIIIDWERHSIRNIFFDLSNLLFKLDHHKQLQVMEWKNKQNNIIKLIKIITDNSLFTFEQNIDINRFFNFYILFLLERLELELRIYDPKIEKRSLSFINIWKKHIEKLANFFKENPEFGVNSEIFIY